MAEAAAATEAPSAGLNGSIVDILEGAALEQQAETPSGTEQAKPKETPGLDDPLDEALFSDEHLSTPEQIRAKAALVREQVSEALKIRRAAHNARAEAERREAKFRGTKQATLQEKSAVAATAQFLQGELAEIQSGDPDRFIAAVARLSKHSDPPAFWREVAIKLAQGPAPKAAAAKLDPEQQARLDRLEQNERERVAAARRSEEDSFIAEKEGELFTEAKASEAHPLLQRLESANRQNFEIGLRNAKLRGYQETGKPIDNKTACDMVEKELRFFSELSQRTDGTNGDTTREKETAALVAGQGGKPGRLAVAKTEPAQSSPTQKSSTVTTVPASLTAEPAASKRGLTESEKRQARLEQLDQIGFFANFGL